MKLLAATNWHPILSVGFLVLIPIVPAVILYRLFEQRTIVKGPFKGLRLDLSGAFAGYFLVLLVCSGLFYGPALRGYNYEEEMRELRSQLEETSDLGTAWVVRGRVSLKNRDGSENQQAEGIGIAILPPPQIFEEGLFEVRVVKDKVGGRVARLPSLRVSKAGYFPADVHLDQFAEKLGKQYDKTIDADRRVITIDTVVELKEELKR